MPHMPDCEVYGYLQVKKIKWKRQWLELAGLVLFGYENKEVWCVYLIVVHWMSISLVVCVSGRFRVVSRFPQKPPLKNDCATVEYFN